MWKDNSRSQPDCQAEVNEMMETQRQGHGDGDELWQKLLLFSGSFQGKKFLFKQNGHGFKS